MKGSTKPIPSPGRTDKFPPPLMRFLRSNVGNKSRSRSRSRSRASPMMFMRKSKNHVVIETTQEPGSPKVTCIGQVRVRRGGTRIQRSSSTRKRQQQPNRNHIRRPCCCCNYRVKVHKPKSLISILKKWACCFPTGHCGKRNDSTSTSRVESTQRVETRVSSTSSSTTENNEEGLVGFITNPPKDALILTRCRSAPYRSSSLASRFWGSPLNHTSSEDNTTKSQSPQNIIQIPISPEGTKSPSPQNIIRELENEKPVLENPNNDLESREEMQSSINEEDSRKEEVYNVNPLLLTRCKSEPARAGERLNPIRFNELDSQS